MITATGSDDSTQSAAKGLALIRFALGMMFVWVFFENLHKGLYTPEGYANLIKVYTDHGRAPAFWKGIMSLVASKAALAGPAQAMTEISLGVLLVTGSLTRLAALIAFFFLTSLWVSEWGTAWIWELLIPMAVALGLMFGRAGRKWGIDAILARRYPGSPLW